MRPAFLLIAFVILSACDSGGAVGASCSYASQCQALLQCQLGHCRHECTHDSDCSGGTCLFEGQDDQAPGACTLAVEDSCTATSCPTPLVCTPSGCRTPCSEGCRGGTSCVGDVCTSPASDAGTAVDAGTVDAGTVDAG